MCLLLSLNHIGGVSSVFHDDDDANDFSDDVDENHFSDDGDSFLLIFSYIASE